MIADDAGWGLELPQGLARFRVHRFQPSFHRAVEDHVAGGGEGSAPVRQPFLHAPHLLTGRRIPCDELAPVAAGTRMADDDRADVRLARLILDLNSLVIHAE